MNKSPQFFNRMPLTWAEGTVVVETLDTPLEILWPLSPLLKNSNHVTSSLSSDYDVDDDY